MRTYITMDYDTISYAGQDLEAAKGSLKGFNSGIEVWENGKWIGKLNDKGEWTFKTKHFPKD